MHRNFVLADAALRAAAIVASACAGAPALRSTQVLPTLAAVSMPTTARPLASRSSSR